MHTDGNEKVKWIYAHLIVEKSMKQLAKKSLLCNLKEKRFIMIFAIMMMTIFLSQKHYELFDADFCLLLLSYR